MKTPKKNQQIGLFLLMILGSCLSWGNLNSNSPPQKSCDEIFLSSDHQLLLQKFASQQNELSDQLLKNLGMNIQPEYFVSSLGTALDYFLSSQKFKTQRLMTTLSPLTEETSLQMSAVQRNYELAIQYSGPITSYSNQLLFAQSIRDTSNQWNQLPQLPVFARNEKNILLKSSDAELWLKIVLDQDVFEPLLGESISFHLTPKALHSIQNDLQRSAVLRHLVWRLIFDIQVEKAAQQIQLKFADAPISEQLQEKQMELAASRQAVRRQFLAYLVKVKGLGSSRFSNAAHSYLDAFEISVRDKVPSEVSQFLKTQLDIQNRSPDAKMWKSYFQEWKKQIQKSNTRWSPFRWWSLLFI